jgi:hypothetical protein
MTDNEKDDIWKNGVVKQFSKLYKDHWIDTIAFYKRDRGYILCQEIEFLESLDEIERLQARVQELEVESSRMFMAGWRHGYNAGEES